MTTRVPEATTLRAFVESQMGFAGPITLRSVAKASGIKRSELDELEPGTKIVLPYMASVVSYPVKASAFDRVEKAIEQIRKSDDAIANLEVSRELVLTPYAKLATEPNSCPLPIPSKDGHCDVDDLKDFPVVHRTIVAVLDSGLPEGDDRFAPALWQNLAEVDGIEFSDDDRNHFIDDTIGTDLITKGGFPTDDVTLENMAYHGTHVAGIASCRRAPKEHQALINERLQLMVLKVADSDGTIRPDAVVGGISYAIKQKANVVNMSLEGEYIDAVGTMMMLSPGMLFVAAAGNGIDSVGRPLGSHEVYPAMWSKELPNVMTVAAHDGRRRRTCFSNFGDEYVDIAAPGLDIRSTIAGGDDVHSGTSQATPLVTLGAALLYSRGLEKPEQIRQRLVLSADYVPELRGEVRSEGVVNIGKALAYDHDIIRRSAETLVGDLIAFDGIALPGQPAIPVASIRKVINGYSDAPGERVKILTTTGAKFADAALPELTIRTTTGDVTVPGSDIIEIIPRMR